MTANKEEKITNLNSKKLVFWGTGEICKTCIKYRCETLPDFFIDSNPKGVFFDKHVYEPSEIKNWNELFIVITNIHFFSIEKYLVNLGLIKGKDFTTFTDFFNIKVDIQSSLDNVFSFLKKEKTYTNATFIFAPMFTGRRAEQITSFFREYIKKRKLENKKVVVFSCLDGITEKVATDFFETPTFNLSCIFRWNGSCERYDYLKNYVGNYKPNLSDKEKYKVKEIEQKKSSFDFKKSLDLTTMLWAYLRDIFVVAKPSNIIIWGWSSRSSFVLEELAKNYNIPYGYMEYGWISGTYQFDKCGISGQSEYALNPQLFYDYKRKVDKDYIEKIKNYVLKNQLDTGLFKNIPEDEKQLQKIDKNKKTVFFVGMGDAEMAFNTENECWKSSVSDIVSSTKEAYEIIKNICKKNDFNFIFKPHPAARLKTDDEKYRSDVNAVYITDMSIDKLINLADLIVSIASVVDYKVLMYKKPLVSLGKTTFNGKNCLYNAFSKDKIEETMLYAIQNGMTQEQCENFNRLLQFELDYYLWDDGMHKDFNYGLSLDKDFFVSTNRNGGGNRHLTIFVMLNFVQHTSANQNTLHNARSSCARRAA